MSNIKKILKIQNQGFQKIRKDDSIIVVEANDPVFASSTINLLFGIDKVAIAKEIKNEDKSEELIPEPPRQKRKYVRRKPLISEVRRMEAEAKAKEEAERAAEEE